MAGGCGAALAKLNLQLQQHPKLHHRHGTHKPIASSNLFLLPPNPLYTANMVVMYEIAGRKVGSHVVSVLKLPYNFRITGGSF